MADPTPWLVCEQPPAPGCPPNVHRCRCLRCGDVHDIDLTQPIAVADYLARMESFGKRHRKCRAVTP